MRKKKPQQTKQSQNKAKKKGYDVERLFEQAKQAIVEYKLILISEISAFLPCSRATFYNLFNENNNFDKLEALRDLIEDNKINIKSQIRAKLLNSEKSAELLALYRLCATPEENKVLNQQYVELANATKQKGFLPIDLTIKDNKDETSKTNANGTETADIPAN